MQYFQKEIDDGLKEVMESNDSIALECPILGSENIELLLDEMSKSLASINNGGKKQEDLHYINAVLVSAGWNKNDDVFDVANLWEARHTPVNKQFNYMHDETDIIGHITGSMVVDREMNLIPEDTDLSALPQELDVITSAVIYKTWSDHELRMRASQLISEIEEGKWCVSMECVFRDFDYAVIAPDGTHKVLARSADSAFLTKHLRAYGGSGEYQGYKLGRMLKSFYFTGKGLVDKPANPRSVILRDDINPFHSEAEISLNLLTAKEVDMTDTVNTQELDDVRQELSNATEKNDALASQNETLTSQNEAFASELNEKNATVTSLETKVTELEASLAAVTEERDALTTELSELKAGIVQAERRATLVSAGADENTVNDIMEKFASASEDMFASVVALIASKPEAPKPEDEKPVEASNDEEDEEEDEEAEASLDEVEVTEASLNDTGADDSENKTIASAIEWFGNNVLKSTPKNKK